MEALKPSGFEGFGEIPADWEVTKMAFTFSFGKGLSITKEDLQDEGVPSITYGDIHSRFGFQINPEVDEVRCVDHRYLKSGRTALLQFGDFIFADTSEDIAGSGDFTHLNNHAPAFAGYHTITARAKRELDVRFVAYLFDSEPFRNQIRNSVSGVKVFSITQTILKNAKLLLPPMPEQQAIAALLDDCCGQVDSMMADLERQVELLQQYKKALITETVTKGLDKNAPMKDSGIEWLGEIPKHWEVKKIKYCTEKIGSGKTPLGGAEIYDSEGVIFIRSQNVYDDGLRLEDVVFINESIDRSMMSTRVRQGDVLFNITGASIGRCCIYDIAERANVNQHVCIIRTNRTVLIPDYLRYALNSSLGQTQVYICQMGGNRESVTFEKLGLFAIPLMSVDEQNVIVQYLDNACGKANDIIAEKQKAIETMRQYKQSLIYEYVTGKKRIAH